jgi:glycosyltransferase involved in cell wall biosynthesis
MKIVHICPTHFSPDSVIAGAERYSYDLAKAMAKVAETTLVTFGPTGFVRQEGGLTIKCFRRLLYVRGNKANPFSLSYGLDLMKADVIHCHQFKIVATDLAILVGAAFGKKVFVTDLGGDTDFSLSYHLPLWKGVSALLLTSNYNRDRYRHLPIEAKIIYGGVETNLFSPGPGPKTERILFVGRLLPSKGIDVLIEALADNWQLDVVGQAYDGDYLTRLKTLSVGKRVQFYTDLPDNQLIRKYQEARLTVIPCLVDGGYTTAMESMACQTPVVASAVGSLPEIVEDGVTGMLVPPGDPQALRDRIGRFFQHPELAVKMGRRGRESVLDKFTWDRVVDRCLAAYGID